MRGVPVESYSVQYKVEEYFVKSNTVVQCHVISERISCDYPLIFRNDLGMTGTLSNNNDDTNTSPSLLVDNVPYQATLIGTIS